MYFNETILFLFKHNSYYILSAGLLYDMHQTLYKMIVYYHAIILLSLWDVSNLITIIIVLKKLINILAKILKL